MIPLKIQLKSNLPVCPQIIQAVRKAVLCAQLHPGTAFPSVRELSRALHISCTTAHKAVDALKHSGHLACRPGIGMVVTAPRQPSRDRCRQRLQPHCARLLKAADGVQLNFSGVVEALGQTTQARGPHGRPVKPHPTAKRSRSMDWIPSHGQPGVAQIVQAARKALLTGRFKAGDAFPSVRALSAGLGISTNTVHKAVATLKQSGHLAGRRGLGLVVQAGQGSLHEERLEYLAPLCVAVLAQADALGLAYADVVEVLRHLQEARQADYWKAQQSEWETMARKLLPRWSAHGSHCVHQNEFPQMDHVVAVHIEASQQLKVVEFVPGASQRWIQGGFLFVADASPEAINLVQEHTKGLKPLNRCWFAYEECRLFFALGHIHNTFPSDLSGWLG